MHCGVLWLQLIPAVAWQKDLDVDLGSEFFETRQAFLSLCQGNHYQFDSMRRAKHSSMMVLYHLHNPEAPAFSSTCNFCHVEIEPGTGLRALFQHAVQCQQKVTGGCHLCKKMWCLLNLHAKSCTTSDCPVPRCRELKDLRRRQTAHIEQKRRAAYASMMRNAAAGVK
eukprot:gene14539-14667_t